MYFRKQESWIKGYHIFPQYFYQLELLHTINGERAYCMSFHGSFDWVLQHLRLSPKQVGVSGYFDWVLKTNYPKKTQNLSNIASLFALLSHNLLSVENKWFGKARSLCNKPVLSSNEEQEKRQASSIQLLRCTEQLMMSSTSFKMPSLIFYEDIWSLLDPFKHFYYH